MKKRNGNGIQSKRNGIRAERNGIHRNVQTHHNRIRENVNGSACNPSLRVGATHHAAVSGPKRKTLLSWGCAFWHVSRCSPQGRAIATHHHPHAVCIERLPFETSFPITVHSDSGSCLAAPEPASSPRGGARRLGLSGDATRKRTYAGRKMFLLGCTP